MPLSPRMSNTWGNPTWGQPTWGQPTWGASTFAKGGVFEAIVVGPPDNAVNQTGIWDIHFDGKTERAAASIDAPLKVGDVVTVMAGNSPGVSYVIIGTN